MSFSRAAKRPRTNSASERNARITRKSSTSRARKPLYESNARVPVPRKRGRRDTVTEKKKGKITRKSTLSTARTRTIRPVRGAGAKRKSSKKPMPTTMSGMRTEIARLRRIEAQLDKIKEAGSEEKETLKAQVP